MCSNVERIVLKNCDSPEAIYITRRAGAGEELGNECITAEQLLKELTWRSYFCNNLRYSPGWGLNLGIQDIHQVLYH